MRVEALVVFIFDADDDEQLSLTWALSRPRWLPAAVNKNIKYKYKKSHTSYWHYGNCDTNDAWTYLLEQSASCAVWPRCRSCVELGCQCQLPRPFFMRVEALVLFILDADDDEQVSLTWAVSRPRSMPAAVNINIKYKYKKSHSSYWHYGDCETNDAWTYLLEQSAISVVWLRCRSCVELGVTRLPVRVTQALLLASRGSGGLHSWCW